MIDCIRLLCSAEVKRTFPPLLIMFLALIFPSTCRAEGEKHALLIGNSSYTVGALNNPGNDARLMQRVLKDLGFVVTLKLNLDHQAMDAAISEFGRGLPRGSMALFFFAGHGISVDDKNYLIPVDARIDDPTAVKYKAVPEEFIKDHLEGASSSLNVLILDCCRDNPFRSWARNIGPTHLSTSGAAEIPEGWIVAYAVAGGKAALDGVGNNSPFTEALAQVLSEQRPQGLLLRDVFFDASHAVKRNSGQRPFLYMDASIDRFFLREPTDPTADATVITSSLPMNPNVKPEKALQVSPISDEMVKPAPESLGAEPNRRHLLLEQAKHFADGGQLDLAIEAFSAVIDNEGLPAELRDSARKGRGACYVERGTVSDLRRALIDYQAVGIDGFTYVMQANSASLKVGSETRGLVRKGQIIRLTRAQGDWFWVNSVQGDTDKSGWLSKEAFGKAVAVVPPSATSGAVVSRPGTSGIRPANATSTFPQSPGPTTQQVVAEPQVLPGSRQMQPQFRPQQNPGIGNQGVRIPSGADDWTRRYMQKHGRPPSIWETPKWESPAEIREKRAKGLLR